MTNPRRSVWWLDLEYCALLYCGAQVTLAGGDALDVVQVYYRRDHGGALGVRFGGGVQFIVDVEGDPFAPSPPPLDYDRALHPAYVVRGGEPDPPPAFSDDEWKGVPTVKDRAETLADKAAVIQSLMDAWKRHPEWRLTQLIINALGPPDPCPLVFYAEDMHLKRVLDET